MSAPVLRAEGVVVRHRAPEWSTGTAGDPITAVDGVDLEILPGQTLGLVGESGCGKSSLARALMRLDPLAAGRVWWEGVEVGKLSQRELRPLRRRMQLIFQDPAGALDPRLTVGAAIEEPLEIHGVGSRAERRDRAALLLEKVGLGAALASRYPHQLSGGQRQRVGVARALALQPALLIADEPVSSLDVSVQAQIVNLLADLQRELRLAYLFISHDLPLVAHLADRVAVMYLGRVVELAPAAALFATPRHPYSEALLAATPGASPSAARLTGEMADARRPPTGCRFHPRCPRATERCSRESPPLFGLEGGRQVACFLVEEEARRAASLPAVG